MLKMFVQNLLKLKGNNCELPKNILIPKRENGRRARNDETKARLKPSRKTLLVALRGVRGPVSMALLLAVHSAPFLGWCHLLFETLMRRSMFQHLKDLENPTAV